MPEGVTLRAGELEAVWAPEVGMVCSSLTHRGEQLLGLRDGLDGYRERGSTFGVPLLAPWANRISAPVDSAAPVKLDEHGLAIHGLLTASPLWRVETAEEDRVEARLSFDAPELLAGFPHRHELTVTATLTPDALEVATTIEATGDEAVPVSFGWHPYLAPPGAREEWSIELPLERHALLDERGLPTGEEEPAGALDGALGDRTFDDMYLGVGPGAELAVTGGGRRVALRFGEGYPVAQVYSPEHGPFICFEPMTAPTNALVTGEGLRRVQPGERFTARFAIAVSAA